MLRAYIESNLAFMRDNRNVIAMVEIAGSAEDASSTVTLTWSMRSAPSSTCRLASRQQASSVLTSTSHVLAIAIRAVIEAASPRLALDPKFDIDNYASQIATIFDLATRVEGGP